MPLSAGTRLGVFEILAPIGKGGMGEVYRAKDTSLGRDVALKVLPAEMASSSHMLERFRREARAVAALNHPHIVTIHSVEMADGVHFLTMELIEGRSLDHLIPEGGLEVQPILDIAIALSGALAAAHDKGIVHRDLKPANVMVTNDGSVKVLDFGLAKVQGPEPAGDNSELSTAMETSAGVVMGTRPYMSPEQVQDRALDHRTDIFSLGVVLYEMTTGRRPFQGQSSADISASILRDAAPPVTDTRGDLPPDLVRVIRRCLEKAPRHRMQTARDIGNELRETARLLSQSAPIEPARAVSGEASSPVGADEGFRVAVLPFKHSGTSADLETLAEGMSEEIITGLSRFSYLRVIATGSTQGHAHEGVDVRAAGKEIGARYVMEGSLRQAGSQLRVAVQLVDVTSGAHLWAETYNRPFVPEEIFALQDELVPRIVSTVADMHGVLPRSMSEVVRSRPPDQLSPYEAVLRAFGYFERVTPEELAAARSGLGLAVRKAPAHADAWAMLALLCVQDHGQGFDLQADSLASGLTAARRAVEAAPSNHLAHFSLAQALFFQKELPSFRNAAERAAALNPMDGNSIAFLGELLTYAGDWERGLGLADRAKQLNPNHPGWYWYPNFYDSYRQGDYRGALGFALKVNLPGHWGAHVMKAAAYGQLGERDAAGKAKQDLLRIRPDFAATVRSDFEKWFDPEYGEHLIDGLRKAGLDIAPDESGRTSGSGSVEAAAPTTPLSDRRPSIAVLPFVNRSDDPGNEYFSDGLTEELITDLAGIKALSVISRTSAMLFKGTDKDLRTIGRELGVRYVLEGSVRKAGSSLRITAQLVDAEKDSPLWSEKYSGTVDDVFEVQERVSREIVRALDVTLTSDENRRLAERPIANARAFELYLQARQELRQVAGAAIERAPQLLAQAIDIEGETPPLMALEAWILVARVKAGISRDLQPLDDAEASARALLARAPDRPYGHGILGFVCYERGRLPEAIRHLKQSLDRSPNDPDALWYMCATYMAAGHTEGGIETSRRMKACDPLSAGSWMCSGAAHWFVGRFETGLPELDRGLALDPQNYFLRWTTGYTLAALGRVKEASRHAQFLVETGPDGPYTLQLLALIDAIEGRSGAAASRLSGIDFAPLDSHTLFHLAEPLALAGDHDRALDLIERTVDGGFYPYPFLSTHCPFLAPLRSLPRFAGILAKAKERTEAFLQAESDGGSWK